MLLEILKIFCSNTTIHGFAYTADPLRQKIERIFWIVSIFVSFIMTGALIHKLLSESQKNPVVIYTDQNVINIEDLNFPAVSFCPGMLYKTPCETIIDYGNIKTKLMNGTMSIENLTLNELKLMQITSLVARDHFLSENFPQLMIPTGDIMEKLEMFNLTYKHQHFYYDPESMSYGRFLAGSWGKLTIDFMQVPCESGLCYTANRPKAPEMFSEKSIYQNISDKLFFRLDDYDNTASESGGIIKNLITLDSQDTPQKFDFNTFYITLEPFDVCNTTDSSGHEIFKEFEHSNFSVPQKPEDGFMLKFHDPYEVPSQYSVKFMTMRRRVFRLIVSPIVYRLDSSLKDSPLKLRNCYLPGERKLEYFKVYTKVNCEHECLAQKILNSCGCVQFYMARNSSTKVCGTTDEKCFVDIEDEFDQNKSSCGCLEACERVKYEIEMRENLSTVSSIDIERNYMYVLIEQRQDFVYAISSRRTLTIGEMFSFIGGLLGLFVGFSILSGVEVIYYLVVRPLMEVRKRNDTKVFPFTKDDEEITNEVRNFTLLRNLNEMLQNSSIHSLNHVGNQEYGIIGRTIWFVIFFFAMAGSFFCIKDVYQTYQEQSMSIMMEGSPTKVEEIPFPAFTILRDYEMNLTYSDDVTNLDHSDEAYINKLFDEFYNAVCNDDVPRDYASFEPFVFKNTSDIVEVMRYYNFYQKSWFYSRNITWNGIKDLPITTLLTYSIFGYAINMMDSNKLLTDELSQDLKYSYLEDVTYPWTMPYGNNHELKIEVDNSDNPEFRERSDHCTGYDAIFVHPPDQLPVFQEYFILMAKNFHYQIYIAPEIVKTDDDLRSVDVNVRKCFFHDERKLKFFKIYTQKNCEHECRSFTFVHFCGCTLYSYVRNSTTEVCDDYRWNLCTYQFKLIRKFSLFDHFYETHGECKCLPACSYINYNFEIVQDELKNNLVSENTTTIVAKWKDAEYYAMVRYQQLKFVDFLSYIGGILSLFAGISVLSIIEVCYFLTLKLTADFMQRVKN